MTARLCAALLLVVLAACGGSDSTSPSGPSPSVVTFKIDAQTCSGTATINFFIDGSTVGSESLTAGSSSKGYSTTQTSHVLGASVANTNGRVWGPITVNLTNIATYTQVLVCS